MSNRLLSLAWEIPLSPLDKLVLVELADRANDITGQCWPAVKTLVRRTGASERTVQRCLAALVSSGHISRRPDAKKKANVYTVHPRHSGTPDAQAPRHSDTVGVSDSHPMGVTQAPQGCHSDTQTQREPKDKPKEPSFSAHECAQEGLTPDLAIQLWNQVAARCALPLVTKLKGKQLANLKATVAEHSLDDWRETMQAIADSDRLCGRKGDWQVTLQWLIDPGKDGFERVRNGEFDNGPDPNTSAWVLAIDGRPSRNRARNRRRAMRQDFDESQLLPEADAIASAFADVNDALPF